MPVHLLLDVFTHRPSAPAPGPERWRTRSPEDVYVVSPVGDPAAATEWRARMLAPATGAAAAPFAGYLAQLDGARERVRTWIVHQGIEMGRPSRIEVTVHSEPGGGDVASVEVGGSVLIVGSGRIELPS